jgi:hypothetical protein
MNRRNFTNAPAPGAEGALTPANVDALAACLTNPATGTVRGGGCRARTAAPPPPPGQTGTIRDTGSSAFICREYVAFFAAVGGAKESLACKPGKHSREANVSGAGR